MRVKALKVVIRVLVFGLLLGGASTAYADALVITSFTFGNLQFTPAAGTAVFTPTGANVRARAMNSPGENPDISSNTFPAAQATATVTFAGASAAASATNQTAKRQQFCQRRWLHLYSIVLRTSLVHRHPCYRRRRRQC